MKSARIIAGGDVMFKPRLAEIGSSTSAPVREALSLFSSGQICFMNCEMPLTDRGQPAEKTINIRANPGVAEDLKSLGVDIVTLANNHAMDYGREGFSHTLENLDRAGIKRVGAGQNIDEALQPEIIESNGLRFAFFGLACTLPPGSAAGPDRAGIAPVKVNFSFEMNTNLMSENPGIAPIVRSWAVESDVERVCQAVERTKQEVDYVVVGLHWGIRDLRITPIQGPICEYQPPLARALIDSGVDVIVGNGPHCLRGIEIYRDRPIFYCLGDLIFHKLPVEHGERESAILQIDFDGESIKPSLVPVVLNDDLLPELAFDAERERVANLIVERSERFGTQFRWDGDALHVVI